MLFFFICRSSFVFFLGVGIGNVFFCCNSPARKNKHGNSAALSAADWLICLFVIDAIDLSFGAGIGLLARWNEGIQEIGFAAKLWNVRKFKFHEMALAFKLLLDNLNQYFF